jgi:hypothetical protein
MQDAGDNDDDISQADASNHAFQVGASNHAFQVGASNHASQPSQASLSNHASQAGASNHVYGPVFGSRQGPRKADDIAHFFSDFTVLKPKDKKDKEKKDEYETVRGCSLCM